MTVRNKKTLQGSEARRDAKLGGLGLNNMKIMLSQIVGDGFYYVLVQDLKWDK